MKNEIPNLIEATYKVVTPLFISGEDHKEAELRGPSIKGALRFWYRAIALPRLGSWKKVKDEEQKIFGSSDTGQGQFLLRVTTNDKVVITQSPQLWPDHGSAYLGYGLIGLGRDGNRRQVQTSRPYINPGTTFTVEIILKPNCPIETIPILRKSLIALGLLGGLGARSRHGFGSLAIESLKIKVHDLEKREDDWFPPGSREDLYKEINCFVGELVSLSLDTSEYFSLPEYSSLSEKSRISILDLSKDALNLLDCIGKEMLRYRSYGSSRNGSSHKLPWGEPAQQNFIGDHNLILNYSKTGQAPTHPCRVVFGLPHNYFFSPPAKINVNVNAAKLTQDKLERRASPLFIHIHPIEGQYTAILTLLPAVFLPEGEKINIGNRVNVDVKVDYNDIHQFMDRFPNRLEVKI